MHALEAADGSASHPADVPTDGSTDGFTAAAFGFDPVDGDGAGREGGGSGSSSLESVLTAILAPIMQSTDARTTLPTATTASSTNSTDRAQRFNVGAGAIEFHKQRVVRCAYACATLVHEFNRQGLKVPFTLKLKSAGIGGVGGVGAGLGAHLGMQPGGSGFDNSQDGNRMELVLEWDRHAAPLLDSWAGTPPGTPTRGDEFGNFFLARACLYLGRTDLRCTHGIKFHTWAILLTRSYTPCPL